MFWYRYKYLYKLQSTNRIRNNSIFNEKKKKKKFINFSNAEDESHCHIYFNDNNTEIKWNYLVKKDKVSKIKIILDAKFNSFNKLFFGCRIIKEINFIKFNRKDIKDMSYMFFNCKKLKKLNIFN